MSKKPEPFNNPFAKVKLDDQAAPAKAAKPQAPARTKSTTGAVDDDAALFREAVGEVATVRAGKQRVGPPAPRSADQVAIQTEEAESLARLAELVSSAGEFEVSDSSSLIEGWVHGLDANVMRRLRQGDFGTHASLDLHGLRRDEARAALEQFIGKARIAGHRCVLIVTGRGLHSEDQVPVIKQGVQEWLTHGRTSKQVLGFCSAKPKDGGAGAVYVLLRR